MRAYRACISALLAIILFLSPSQAGEENDLWLLLSSYEDIGATVKDLAFFLATHGYNVQPEDSYVTVTFSDGQQVYLTPNGGAARLADLWMEPPTGKSGPMQVIPTGAIQVNMTYNNSDNADFIKAVSRYTMFPVTPLGMCYDGSQQLDEIYKSFDYNVRYLYDPNGFDSQGHLWVALEDDHSGNWLAVDSYYGVMIDNESYYYAPYSFEEFKYLDSINPKWSLA